jgi:hypothetical protein
MQFYTPEANATFLKSWGESEAVPSNPFNGISAPFAVAYVGTYALGDSVYYQVLPYRQGAERVYAGAMLAYSLTMEEDEGGFQWPAWSASPGWASGFSVLRHVNGSYAGFIDVPVGGMVAGWMDDAWGWSGPESLPCSYSSPPKTAKVLWNVLDASTPPVAMTTVSGVGGGLALDSTLGDKLVRLMSHDLRAQPEGTFAFWFCPTDNNGWGVIATLRGVYDVNYLGDYSFDGTSLFVGDLYTATGGATATGHQVGDWYLVVLRRDAVAALSKVDLVRQRDGVQFSAAVPLFGKHLEAGDDYISEGIQGVACFGGSYHWGTPSYGYYDRMGVWNRSISDEEVEELFNVGLGWAPA